MISPTPILELVRPHLKKIKGSGPKNIMACCPFHQDRNPSFALNIYTGAWMCHGCKEGGGLQSLLRGLGVGATKMDAVLAPIREDMARHRDRECVHQAHLLRQDPLQGTLILPEAVLAVYDYLPTRLRDDGFNIRTLKRLGIGYDRSKHRITFPIRDGYGNLVGLAGRAVIGPRYKVYRGGYKDEAGNMIVGDFGPEFDQMFPGYELKKSLHLWNAYNVLARQEMGETAPVIIVEGYKAAIWLIQHGYQHVVALMGSALSMIQLVILGVLYTGEFILFLDADKPGVDATKRIGQWLIGKGYTVSVARYPDPMMRQPDDMSDAGLGLALEERKRFATWDLLREKQLQPVSG